LAKNCRSKGRRDEKKKEGGNRFKVLENRVMQCGVREVRRQEVVEDKMQCFKCGEEGHKKWECPKRRDTKREGEERAGITDLEKTVQKGQREVRRTLRGLREV